MLERTKYVMPENNDTEATRYAGQDAPHETKAIMKTGEGKMVKILGWNKEKGLHFVMDFDKPGEHSPGYHIDPDKLFPISEEE